MIKAKYSTHSVTLKYIQNLAAFKETFSQLVVTLVFPEFILISSISCIS